MPLLYICGMFYMYQTMTTKDVRTNLSLLAKELALQRIMFKERHVSLTTGSLIHGRYQRLRRLVLWPSVDVSQTEL